MTYNIPPSTTTAGSAVSAPQAVINCHAQQPLQIDDDMLDMHIQHASKEVWDVDSLRPMQQNILHSLLHPQLPNHILAIHKTGGGKTHIIRTAGVYGAGIILIFIPLLTLSADVLKKFTTASTDFGDVRVFHLDELHEVNHDKYKQLLQRIGNIHNITEEKDSTLFVFLSPQFFINNKDACDVMIRAAECKTLRLVCMDEFHVHCQHGSSFRSDCRALRDIFFGPVFQPSKNYGVRFLGTSATVPNDYIDILSDLTTIPFPPESIKRGTFNDFKQDEITMEQVVCTPSDFVKLGISTAAKFMATTDGSRKMCIFCNSKAKAAHFVKELERKLNEQDITGDTILITGDLHKFEKFWRIQFFCSANDEHIEGVKFRVLISTNAANVGIDNHAVDFGIRFQFPRDLCTYLQERARGSRIPHAPSRFIVYLDINSFQYIMKQILSSGSDDEVELTDEQLSAMGYGSSITPLRNSGERRRAQQCKTNNKYALTKRMKKNLRERQHRELLEVCSFFCLNAGCQHRRSQYYLSTGRLDGFTMSGMIPCNAKCPICSGKWQKQFLPVYKESVVSFLSSSLGRESFPMVVDMTTSVSDVLWGQRDHSWIEKIFDRSFSGIKRSNVDSLFLSLTAAGIIQIEKTSAGVVRWNICYSDDSSAVYLMDNVWTCINMHQPDRTRMLDTRRNRVTANANTN